MKKLTIKITLLGFAFLIVASLAFSAGGWVAKVDGKVISDTELNSILTQQQLLAEIGSGRSLATQFKTKKFQRQILEMQIMQQLMVNEIKKINTTKRFIDAATIQQEKIELSTQIEKALWIRAYTNKVLRPQITVSDQAIDNFYNQNKDKFKNATMKDARDFIKEELVLQQIQPLIVQLQTKVKTESNVNINDKYFQ